MPKKYKVKRYYKSNTNYYKSRTATGSIIWFSVMFAVLAAVGVALYRPVYDYVMSFGKTPEVSQSAPESQPVSSEPEPEPEPEPVPEPPKEPLRAVYAPAALLADEEKLDEWISSLEGTGINALMAEIKDAGGNILYKTENERALQWGLVSQNPLDLQALSSRLEQDGLSLVVKMSLFRDPAAASAGRSRFAIMYQNTDYLWLDAAAADGGKPWLNPYSQDVREYLEFFALEAADMGAAAVVLADARFPDWSAANASFGEVPRDLDRAGALEAVLSGIDSKLSEKNVKSLLYITASDTAQAENHEIRYGTSPLTLARDYVLFDVSPAQFAGGFSSGGLNIPSPLENPAEAVSAGINYARQSLDTQAILIPAITGGNSEPFNETLRFTTEEIAEQIKICEQLSQDGYFLYNPSGEYLLK